MPQWLRPLLTRALIDVMEGRSPAPIASPTYAQLDTTSASAAAGRYRVDRVGLVTLEARAGRLYLRIARGIEYPAIPVADGPLYVPGLDVWIGFPADSEFRRLTWLSIFDISQGVREL